MSTSTVSDVGAAVPGGAAPHTSGATKRVAVAAKWRKHFTDNPAIFVFLGLTVVALGRGLAAMLNGDARKSNLQMRYRVGFQFCVLASVIGGMYYTDYKRLMQEGEKFAVDNRMFDASGAKYELEAAGTDAAAAGAPQPNLK